MELLQETHFEATDRELIWFERNKLHRVNFDFSDPTQFLRTTYYIDEFPLFPRVLIWCHNYIPMFPYLARIAWHQLPDIPLGLKKDDYRKIIKEYIAKIRSGDASLFLSRDKRR